MQVEEWIDDSDLTLSKVDVWHYQKLTLSKVDVWH